MVRRWNPYQCNGCWCTWEQASHSGEINVPLSKRILNQNNLHAKTGEVITSKKPGRLKSSEITIFDSTGLTVQDIATARSI